MPAKATAEGGAEAPEPELGDEGCDSLQLCAPEAEDCGNNGITLSVSGLTVTLDENVVHGTISADKTEDLTEGETVTLSAAPEEGWALVGWNVIDANGGSVTVTDGSFVMPASSVTVSASFLPVLPEGENRVLLERWVSAYYAFVPTQSGVYRFRIVGGTSGTSGNLYDGDTLIGCGWSDYAEGFSFSADLEGGRVYRLKLLQCSETNFETTVVAQRTDPYAITPSLTEHIDVIRATSQINIPVSSACEGERISLDASAEAGWAVCGWTVIDESGANVAVTDGEFFMPASPVTVSADAEAYEFSFGSFTDCTINCVYADGKSINDGAFCNCNALTSMHIPASVTSIGENAFLGCTKLAYLCSPVADGAAAAY